MEQNTNIEENKLKPGAYADLDIESNPKVIFDINKPVVVTFSPDFEQPKEIIDEQTGAFYLFDCLEEGIKKVIVTSAYTLMKGLKQNEPLANKTLKIEKKLKGTKQYYYLEEIN